jgi:hypothetical protein
MGDKEDPGFVALDDVIRMNERQWRTYSYMKLNGMDGKLSGMDRKLSRIDNRLWALLVAIIVMIATVVGSAVL